MTVSRVLNQSGYVGEATRVKVLAAIEELGYIPNQNARGLRSARSGIIALLVTDITNPFFTTIARGVEDIASGSDHLVLVGNTDEFEAEELRYMKMLVQKGVDGVLFVPAQGGEEAIELAQQHDIPVVVLDRRTTAAGIDSVRCDSAEGAQKLATHLAELGHKHYAILAGPVGNHTADDRIEGFRSALSQECTVHVYHGALTVEQGREMTETTLQLTPRPTAIFATNNFLALGAINAVRAAGLKIPDDLSVVGFDDLPSHLITFPFLTVTSQPAYEMGTQAADLLLKRFREPDAPYEHQILPTQLLVRNSSGSVPKS
jgi:LacI family transcriptional regulator